MVFRQQLTANLCEVEKLNYSTKTRNDKYKNQKIRIQMKFLS